MDCGWVDLGHRFFMHRNTAKALLTDIHLWVPVLVLGIGLALLWLLH